MIPLIERVTSNTRPAVTVGLAAFSIPVLGVTDYLSGPDMAFSIFYLAPLALVAWTGGRPVASVLAIFAGFTWLIADLAAGVDYSSPLIPVWNTFTRIAVFVLVVFLLASLHAAYATQKELARTDPLTNLANARTFEDGVRRAVRVAHERGYPITLAYLDLDDFKAINDELGHSGGDEVLQRMATAISSNTRSTDVVARLGGDEFAILAPGLGSVAAKSLMDDLMERVSSEVADLPMTTSFSAGCVTFVDPPADINEMIRAADDLMYRVKSKGKNSYEHAVRNSDHGRVDRTLDLRERGDGSTRTDDEARRSRNRRRRRPGRQGLTGRS